MCVWATKYLNAYSSFQPFEDCQGVRVRVTLRLAVYRQSVHLRSKPLAAHDQISFCNGTLTIIVLT
jgi:hypothetical protein